jgi:hypothetical protein
VERNEQRRRSRVATAPMTLGNIRGVHTFAVWCLGRSCNHFQILDVSNYSDETSVLYFGPRLRCERCGHLGADARPNWNERDKREPIARSSNALEIRAC